MWWELLLLLPPRLHEVLSYICITVRFSCHSQYSIHLWLESIIAVLPWHLYWFLKICIKFTPYGKSHVSATSGQFNHPKMFPLFSPHSPTLLPDQGHFEGLVFITLKLLRWVTTGVQENRKIWFLLSGCPLEAEWEACNNSQKKQKKVRNLQLDLCLFHMPYYTCLSSKWLELHGFFFLVFFFLKNHEDEKSTHVVWWGGNLFILKNMTS